MDEEIDRYIGETQNRTASIMGGPINRLNIPRDLNIFQDLIVNRAHSNGHDFTGVITRSLNKLSRNEDWLPTLRLFVFYITLSKDITGRDIALKANQIILSSSAAS